MRNFARRRNNISKFGILLALFRLMRRLVETLLFISLAATPLVTAQTPFAGATKNQQRARQVADRFVARFRHTLDFGIVWKAFRLSHPSCTQRANGILSEADYERLRPSNETVEKLYIATMNFYYLQLVYELSLGRIDSQSGAEESPAPKDIEALEKRSKFFQDDDRKLQNADEIRELIDTFDQLAQLYRKHLPNRAMKSAAWQANQKYLMSTNGDHAGVLHGDATLCVPARTDVYIVDRGIFYFYVVEENGKMRVAGLGVD